MPSVKKKLPWWVKLMRYFGRSVIILWVVVGLLFSLMELIESSFAPIFFIPAVLFLAAAILPWIWEAVGSFLALGLGLAILILFLIVTKWKPNIYMLALSLPGLIGGGSSLASWLVARKAPPKED